MEKNTPQKRKLNKDQLIVLAIIIALTVISWLLLALYGGGGMQGMNMDMTGGADPQMQAEMDTRLVSSVYTPTMPGFSIFVPMWIVMSIGMMLPTAIPMVFTFHAISKRRSELGFKNAPTYLFVLGYAILWAIIGFAFWAAGTLIVYLVGPGITDWTHNMIGIAVIFAVVGAYQLTPLKSICLTGCRYPLQFVLHNWRSGFGGALTMGMKHGIECIGCCWALMAVMFPLGMMNLFWMGVLTVVMFLEKNARYGALISRVVGVIFAIAGGALGMVGIAGLIS